MKSKMELMYERKLERQKDEAMRPVPLHSDEMELIFYYRIMNARGQYSMVRVAQDFAMTPTMRKGVIRGM